MREYLLLCKTYTLTAMCSLMCVCILYCSILYAEHIHLFNQKNMVVLGNNFVNHENIIKSINLNTEQSIFSYDLNEIQSAIETIDFVKSAKVSRIFPATLMIEVVERDPIILVVLDDEKYFFDDTQTPLQAPKKAINFFPVPILSFSNNGPTHLGDFELTKAIRFVLKTTVIHKELYENLSEIRYRDNGISLITDDRTRIELGKDELLYKISVLKEFQNTLKDKRSLDDYSYIDLKVKNQIIVRERNRVRKN